MPLLTTGFFVLQLGRSQTIVRSTVLSASLLVSHVCNKSVQCVSFLHKRQFCQDECSRRGHSRSFRCKPSLQCAWLYEVVPVLLTLRAHLFGRRQLISETTPGNNPNLIKDTLVFAHGAANIILANGKVTGACQLHSTSRWFEIQVGGTCFIQCSVSDYSDFPCLVCPIQSQFSLSRLAQWGEHFCAVESMPPSSPGKTDLEKFSEMYPLCRPSSGRRLAIGQGVLDRAWEQVVRGVCMMHRVRAASPPRHVCLMPGLRPHAQLGPFP